MAFDKYQGYVSDRTHHLTMFHVVRPISTSGTTVSLFYLILLIHLYRAKLINPARKIASYMRSESFMDVLN